MVFAHTQKMSEKELLKKLNEMLYVEGSWMADLLERTTLPFQYIVETGTEDHWRELREKKGLEACVLLCPPHCL